MTSDRAALATARSITALGEITVVRRNDGSAPLAIGVSVGLDWPGELLRVLDNEACA